jgi:hypothetical protein
MHLPFIHPNIGFGELSISGSLKTLHSTSSAGVWGLLAPAQSDIDAQKAKGPSATAAVVAYSLAKADAIYAESVGSGAVTAVAAADGSATVTATHNGPSAQCTAVVGTSANGRGVAGFSTSFQGVYGHSATQAGVVGESDKFDGVFGISHNLSAAGVSGHNPGGLAGFFEGNVTVTGDIFLPGADCAEEFDVASLDVCEPGTVMVIDDNNLLKPSESAYDHRVAGVVSGAGSYRPAVILNRSQPDHAKRATIALTGKVFCKVDADLSPIAVGDLLTTSPRIGYAMRASEPAKAFGCVIGKALRPLERGQDLVPILIALQ